MSRGRKKNNNKDKVELVEKVVENNEFEEIESQPVISEDAVIEEEIVEEKKEVKKEKEHKVKSVNKKWNDQGQFYEADRIVLLVKSDENNTTEFTRKFDATIYINKDKVGKRTKYAENQWGLITEVLEDREYLTFVLEPIVL